MRKNIVSALIYLALAFNLLACGVSVVGGPTPLSSTKAITAFSFTSPAATAIINESAKTIAVTVPYETNVTALVATFTTTGVRASAESTVQISGTTPNDFTSPMIYTVTAADGSTTAYTVTVTIAPSTAKAITAFSFANLGVTGTISETAKVISATVPYGTDVTALAATFTTTGAGVKVGSTVQVSGTTTNNFTNPVVYTVTAADSSTTSYTVTVIIATRVTSLRITDATNPAIGIDDSDNIFALWSASTSTSPNVYAYASRYSLNGWETPTFIGDSDLGMITLLRLAVSPNGSAFAFWYKSTGNLYVSRYVPDKGWGSPEVLVGPSTILDLQAVADANGNSIVVWEEPGLPYYRLYSRRYVPGIGWDSAQAIDDNTGRCDYPRIVADNTGNAIAVWQQYDGTTRVYANRLTAGSNWGTPALISSSTSTAAYTPEIAINKSGSAMAVWYENNSGTYNAYARSFIPSTGWDTVQSIETGTSNVYSVRVAIDDAGTAIALWRQPDLYYSRYVSGSGWDSAQALEAGLDPAVEMNGNGQAVGVWNQWDPTNGYQVHSKKFIPATGWGATSNLVSEPGSANAPHAVMDSRGNATAIWSQTIAVSGAVPTTAVFTKTF